MCLLRASASNRAHAYRAGFHAGLQGVHLTAAPPDQAKSAAQTATVHSDGSLLVGRMNAAKRQKVDRPIVATTAKGRVQPASQVSQSGSKAAGESAGAGQKSIAAFFGRPGGVAVGSRKAKLQGGARQLGSHLRSIAPDVRKRARKQKQQPSEARPGPSAASSGQSGCNSAVAVIDLSDNAVAAHPEHLAGARDSQRTPTVLLFDDFLVLADQDVGFLPALRALLRQSQVGCT